MKRGTNIALKWTWTGGVVVILVAGLGTGAPVQAARAHGHHHVIRKSESERKVAQWSLVGHGSISHSHPIASKYSTAQQVAWHMTNASTLQGQGETRAAVLEWEEVLRLDHSNTEALNDIRQVQCDGARDALELFGTTDTLGELAEALDERTDDQIAQQLLVACRQPIQRIDGIMSHAPDYELVDDIETFIDSNRLGPVVSMAEQGPIAPFSTNRLYGRRFLQAMCNFLPRFRHSRIYFTVTYPTGREFIPVYINDYKFTPSAPGVVTIDGPDIGPNVPIMAVWEGGKWRIAPQPSYQLNFYFKVHESDREW